MSNKNIDIELNQDYFTFGEKKNYRKYQTEQCYIYNNKAIHIQKHVLKKPPYFGNKIRCNCGKQNE